MALVSIWIGDQEVDLSTTQSTWYFQVVAYFMDSKKILCLFGRVVDQMITCILEQVPITVPHTAIRRCWRLRRRRPRECTMHVLTVRQVVTDLGLVDLNFAELLATSAATFCPRTTQPKSATTCITMYSASATQFARRTEDIHSKVRILLS